MSALASPSQTVRRAPAPLDFDSQPQMLKDMITLWRKLIAEDFKGLTFDGKVREGLFRRAETGLNCEAAVAAARACLSALDSEQQKAIRFSLDDRAWRSWCNIHRNVARHGLCMDTLTDDQRELMLGLVQTCVSPEAFAEIRNAMRLNEHLSQMIDKPFDYGQWFYYLSIFGEPSATGPWGWQLDGHHVNVNCFMLGGQMVLTPMLIGAEPVLAESGPFAGTTILRREEASGWKLMAALRPDQQARARIGMDLPFDGYASGFKDNLQMPVQGIAYADLDDSQRALLVDILALYAGRQPAAHAEITLAEAKRYLSETHFSWMGACDEASPFYYRVHNPVMYIEFYHQPGVALPSTGYSRRHAHGLVRTPNGNDYGRVLLSQYRQEKPETAPVTGRF